jgi:hypothetical protein
VVFDAAAASPVEAVNVIVVSATEIQAAIPAHAAGLVDVRVVNPDSVALSPKQSAIGIPAAEFRYFAFLPSAITVTSIAPPSIVEGTPSPMITSGDRRRAFSARSVARTGRGRRGVPPHGR